MAVRFTEKQFEELQSLVTKLQTLTDEDTEEGQTNENIKKGVGVERKINGYS